MKRRVATFLGLVFVVGVLLIPTLHQAHSAACHDHHDAEECPICQLAVMPADVAVPHIEPVPQVLVSVPLCIPEPLIFCAPTICTAQARGPPAA